ncbi:hypothetical protein L6164_002770 [Bauhinia variegata]|uniref:Uncharacterized protein n=1 Tax=Bauhinia variegata TaxID=167791 RepID=A0ACB9PYP0_BAUVA|nr:hypothetical protein L6164_002770 [Bauhinia variegata]
MSFTVVESVADFNHLTANYPREVRDLHPLAPELPSAPELEDGSRALPLMAIQVRVLPNTGFCIGVIFHHAVVDGRAFYHFMKSWASICRTGGFLEEPKPLHSRVEVEDIYGLEKHFLEWWNWELKEGMGRKPNHQILNDNVQATITFKPNPNSKPKELGFSPI